MFDFLTGGLSLTTIVTVLGGAAMALLYFLRGYWKKRAQRAEDQVGAMEARQEVQEAHQKIDKETEAKQDEIDKEVADGDSQKISDRLNNPPGG